MTQEEITEGNILIAEFMGGKKLVNNDGLFTYWGPDNFQHESGEYLKYHSSWDWLMPVVEKIESLYCLEVSIRKFDCIVETSGLCRPRYFVVRSSTRKIESAFGVVIDAIKWINDKKAKYNV